MSGYTFNGFECVGEDCTSDAHCLSPERPICTERGCSGTGEHRDGCSQGFGCRSGLCLNHVCTEVHGEGEDCSGSAIVCAFGLNCFPSGTCEVPFDVDDTCSADEECNLPTESCIPSPVGNTCQTLSGAAESCDDDVDCIGPLGCNTATTQCL